MITKMKKRKSSSFLGYILLFPSLFVFAIFMIWPLIRTVYLSFFDWNMIRPVKKFVGFDNYIAIFKSPLTGEIMLNTVEYILILLILNFILPYILSFILSVVVTKWQGFYKKVYFLPSIMSLVVGSMLYLWILNPVSGPAAVIAKSFGITLPVWSKSEGLVITVISLITSWKVFGYNFIIMLAGVSGISKEVIEVARLDRIPYRRIFTDIVLPMSSATGIYVFIITIVEGLQYVFTPINIITQGGPNYASSNLIYNSYQEAFSFFRTGNSCAFSVITMLIFILMLILEIKFVERKAYYEN